MGFFSNQSHWNTLTYGKPGNCKSLDQARVALDLLNKYYAVEKKYPQLPKRSLWSNQKFSENIEKKELGKHLFYWESPFQLKDLRDVDILWDEIANHLPADCWADTPRWLRALFAQHRKRGIRIFANTQDYKAVDINYRRMCTGAYYVKKITGSRDISATLPPVKFIWGLYYKIPFDPIDVENEKDTRTLLNRFYDLQPFTKLMCLHLIKSRYVKAYDTTQSIPEYMPNTLDHIELKCKDPTCGHITVKHKPI